jgi:hypothetical protein
LDGGAVRALVDSDETEGFGWRRPSVATRDTQNGRIEMRVLINAPTGTATLRIEGGKFTSMFSDTRFFPACRIESFSEREIRVSETKADEAVGSDSFHFTVEWEPLLEASGQITAKTTAGATMIVQLDGSELVRIGERETRTVEAWDTLSAGKWRT